MTTILPYTTTIREMASTNDKRNTYLTADTCRKFALEWEHQAFTRHYSATKRLAMLAESWWRAYHKARENNDLLAINEWYIIRETLVIEINYHGDRDRIIWYAEDFESGYDDISPSAELTIGYCERRAQHYEYLAYTSTEHPEHYTVTNSIESARHWYIMAEQAKVLGGTIPYSELRNLRPYINSETYNSPYNQLPAEDGLPDRKDQLYRYTPKIKQPAPVELPRTTYETPLGQLNVWCSADGQIELSIEDPVTIYTVQYKVRATLRTDAEGKDYLYNQSRRVESYDYPTEAARKVMEKELIPYAQMYRANHPDCKQQAYLNQQQYNIAKARAEIAEVIETLRAYDKYIDILEDELNQSHALNSDDMDNLRKLRHLHLERRG